MAKITLMSGIASISGRFFLFFFLHISKKNSTLVQTTIFFSKKNTLVQAQTIFFC